MEYNFRDSVGLNLKDTNPSPFLPPMTIKRWEDGRINRHHSKTCLLLSFLKPIIGNLFPSFENCCLVCCWVG